MGRAGRGSRQDSPGAVWEPELQMSHFEHLIVALMIAQFYFVIIVIYGLPNNTCHKCHFSRHCAGKQVSVSQAVRTEYVEAGATRASNVRFGRAAGVAAGDWRQSLNVPGRQGLGASKWFPFCVPQSRFLFSVCPHLHAVCLRDMNRSLLCAFP